MKHYLGLKLHTKLTTEPASYPDNYYVHQEAKHLEVVRCWWFCVKLLIIALALKSIWLDVANLLMSL